MNTKLDNSIPAKKVTKKIDDKMTLGMLMRAFRESEEISQVDLASRLGVSKQFLNDVENNRKKIRIPFIQKFATEVGFSPDTFVSIYLRDQVREAGMTSYDVLLIKKTS
jgi:transcriptional regulator with XRE-family HTH domain